MCGVVLAVKSRKCIKIILKDNKNYISYNFIIYYVLDSAKF